MNDIRKLAEKAASWDVPEGKGYNLPEMIEDKISFIETILRHAILSQIQKDAAIALTTYNYDQDPIGSRRELECSQRIANRIRAQLEQEREG